MYRVAQNGFALIFPPKDKNKTEWLISISIDLSSGHRHTVAEWDTTTNMWIYILLIQFFSHYSKSYNRISLEKKRKKNYFRQKKLHELNCDRERRECARDRSRGIFFWYILYGRIDVYFNYTVLIRCSRCWFGEKSATTNLP